MKHKDMRKLGVVAMTLLLAGGSVLAAEDGNAEAKCDALAGQPADIAPSAYQYRANRKLEENPPETEFLFTALQHSREGVVVGLLWEEPRPVEQVVLVWPAGVAPKPEQVVLRWFPEGGSASWWCRAGDGTKLRENTKPVVSKDGRVFTYTLQARDNNAALDNLVIAAPANAVPVVKVLAPQMWQRADLTVEWGFSPGAAKQAFDGRIEIYNGLLGAVAPMEHDPVTTTKGTTWISPAAEGRRGISVALLAVDYAETAVWPGQARIEDVNRTIITIRTAAGSFSFLPADLARGPLLAPEYGFFVRRTADPVTPEQFRNELAGKGLKTLREQIAARAEQSWDNVMRAVHTDIKGDFPAYPQPTLPAPAQVLVPEPYLVSAWSIGAGNMMRTATKDKQGKWFFRDLPYRALAHETHLFMRVLDLMGRHEEARDGYEMWLSRLEQPVPTPDGLWQGGPGRFFSGIEWDNAHGGGISMIHIGMLEHATITGDTEWLKRNAAKLNANADWMVQQRHALWKAVPNSERLWTAGLLPPHNIWDNRVWRSWYESNASFCHALRRHAEIIATVDPETGERYAREAQAFAKDLRAAVEQSLVLSPVIRTRDGMYHSYLPPAPYMRGPASRFMPANFGAQAFGMSMHTPGLYADAIRGGQHILEFGIMPADDPGMQGYLDVLEDRLLAGNFKLFSRFKGYDPERDWFSRAGWYYQAGLERTAHLHLVVDDPASFLRTWYNQFAVEVLPAQAWKFKEHTADHGCMDKPFEEAAFLERFRLMLVMERGEALWLARATPRAWLEQGKKISVKNAPSHFGKVAYEIVSDVEHGKISASVEMPFRTPPKSVLLRFRHPKAAPIKSVTVNQQEWTEFDKDKETIELKGLTGTVTVTANYQLDGRNVTVNEQPLAEGQGRLRIGTHVEGVRLGNTPIMKSIAFEDVAPEGLLKERAELSFAHLQDGYFQWENISKVNFEPFPGDAIGRCINGLTLLSRALHQPAPASLHELVKRSAELHNSDGYLGPQLPESRANEDVLAAHNGYACGLSEYGQWTGDAKATETLKRMSANLFVPARKAISLYRENSDAAAKMNWHLSGGDIGQLFLLLDGITRSYVQVPSPELKATIETMIARYRELDLVKISAQTHAMLSATTGILRWYELQHRPEDLAFAEALYKQYRDLAMTETYENFNWFNRPEWTEACAVTDSFILTVNLWRLTGKVSYLEDAHLILFNGLLPGQLRNGGFGTSPCVGANGICRAKPHGEAPFCCSMRGGEGMARAIQYAYFMERDAVVLAFYSDNTATLRFSDGTCMVRERTGYPYKGKVRLEIVESQVADEKTFRFLIPSWAVKNSLRVTVNGGKVEPSLTGSFAEITVKPAAGTVVEVAFEQEAGPRPALHPDRSPGATRVFNGPLLLGSSSEAAAQPLTPLLEIFDPAKATGGEPYVFFPKGKATPALNIAPDMQPGDCSPQAHVFRRDVPADQVPREVAPLFAALKFDRASAICGFLWDESQEVKQVILQWSENAAMPKPEEVAVRWSESGKMNDAPQPGIIGNGRQWVYSLGKDGHAVAITNLLVSIRGSGVKPDKFGIPDVRVLNHP